MIYSEKTDLINDHALQLINNRSKLKVNDILFSGTGTIGKTAFIAEEPSNWNIKEGVYALTLDTRYVLPMFVLRYLQSQRAIDWIERMAAGSTVRSITMRNLEQLPFPPPPSLRAAPHCGDPRPLRHANELHQRGTAARNCPAS